MIERDVVLSAMSFFFIHVKTGVIFGFIKDAKNEFRMKLVFYITKAGDGNRTHVSSLEGWCSTIELHPHACGNKFTAVGVTGFEPAASWSQTRRSSQAEPHPDVPFTYGFY